MVSTVNRAFIANNQQLVQAEEFFNTGKPADDFRRISRNEPEVQKCGLLRQPLTATAAESAFRIIDHKQRFHAVATGGLR